MRFSRHWLLVAALTALVLLNGKQTDLQVTTNEASLEVATIGLDPGLMIGWDRARTWGCRPRCSCPPQLRKWLAIIVDFYSQLTRQQRPFVQPLRL
jgi:hypothetical protein